MTGLKEEPIKTASSCLYIILLNENTVFVKQTFISFLSLLFFSFLSIILSLYTLSSITLTVLLRGVLVKRDVTSNKKYR